MYFNIFSYLPTTSDTHQASTKKNIENNTAIKSKYERVRNSIESHNLHFSNEFIHINAFIEIAKDTLSKIDGNIGYSYLSNFREKLADEIKTLEDYRDFIQQSSRSFKKMYTSLEALISSLNTSINNDKAEFNQGHIWPIDEVYF